MAHRWAALAWLLAVPTTLVLATLVALLRAGARTRALRRLTRLHGWTFYRRARHDLVPRLPVRPFDGVAAGRVRPGFGAEGALDVGGGRLALTAVEVTHATPGHPLHEIRLAVLALPADPERDGVRVIARRRGADRRLSWTAGDDVLVGDPDTDPRDRAFAHAWTVSARSPREAERVLTPPVRDLLIEAGFERLAWLDGHLVWGSSGRWHARDLAAVRDLLAALVGMITVP
ncbi:MAG: hypothetical protein ACTHOD_03170 [Motilibacteraceae bacterium]